MHYECLVQYLFLKDQFSVWEGEREIDHMTDSLESCQRRTASNAAKSVYCSGSLLTEADFEPHLQKLSTEGNGSGT